MAAIEDILLRTTNHAPYVNKGAALTNSQIDNNFIVIGDTIIAMNNVSAIVAWTAIVFASGSFVRYDNKIWRASGSTLSTEVPGVDAVWVRTTVGELVHEVNKDTYLNLGGANEVTAAQLKAQVNNAIKTIVVSVTKTELLAIFATPKVLITAVTGKTIILLNVVAKAAAGTAAYSNPGLIIKTDTATWSILQNSNILDGTTARTWFLDINLPASGVVTQYIENKSILLTTAAVNPTLGDFGITLYITYREI